MIGVKSSALALLGLALSYFQAVAQTELPAHRLERSGSGCTVTLLPDASRGDGPLLAVQSRSARSDEIQFGLVGPDGLSGVLMVARNIRSDFTPSRMERASVIQRQALWSQLERLSAASLPFHLSGQLPNGDWASSRYSGIAPMSIIRILETQDCYSSATVTARTPAEMREVEDALGLSADDIRHIRWSLATTRNAGGSNVRPAPLYSPSFTSTDRTRIEQYTENTGLPASRFLTRQSANRLLAIRFQPRRPNLASGVRNYEVDRYWRSFWTNSSGSSGGFCNAVSVATSVEGETLWELPTMRFASRNTWSGSNLNIRLVHPLPFREGRSVYALVDGRRYDLQIEDGELKPRDSSGGNLDASVVRAIQRGQNISIVGTSDQTGRLLTVNFSAYGFTTAFRRMSELCGRSQLLNWIN